VDDRIGAQGYGQRVYEKRGGLRKILMEFLGHKKRRF
jgi:hypothetical protein